MPKLLTLYLVIFFGISVIAQDADSLIIEKVQTGKEYIVETWHDISFEILLDSSKKSFHKEYFGSLIKQTQDSIWLEGTKEVVYIPRIDSKKDSKVYKYYDYDYDDDSTEYQNIVVVAKQNCISAMRDRTPILRHIYGGIVVKSLGTAVFIAPLVSVNYREWGFNTKRYFWVAGTSIFTAAVGFSLFKTAGKRRFRLNEDRFKIK